MRPSTLLRLVALSTLASCAGMFQSFDTKPLVDAEVAQKKEMDALIAAFKQIASTVADPTVAKEVLSHIEQSDSTIKKLFETKMRAYEKLGTVDYNKVAWDFINLYDEVKTRRTGK